MKRSEMLDIISTVLNQFYYGADCPLDFPEEVEATILAAIERAGMLPPAYFGEIKTATVKSIKDGAINFETGQTFGLIHEWEVEK